MTQQHLDDPDIDTAFEQVRSKAVPERMNAYTLGQARSFCCRAAGCVEDSDGNRLVGRPSGKQPLSRVRQSPIGPQDHKQLR